VHTVAIHSALSRGADNDHERGEMGTMDYDSGITDNVGMLRSFSCKNQKFLGRSCALLH
jgi:hypothetical protein